LPNEVQTNKFKGVELRYLCQGKKLFTEASENSSPRLVKRTKEEESAGYLEASRDAGWLRNKDVA
jgi:hypothetical protein